ncbi:MAG: hypothetical protein Q7S52_04020 [bacterium]|nr:hypothetical protein [bacterium]
MCRNRKKATWFLQIIGQTKNSYGKVIPRMIDWTARFSLGRSLRSIEAEGKRKAASEGLTEWSWKRIERLGG